MTLFDKQLQSADNNPDSEAAKGRAVSSTRGLRTGRVKAQPSNPIVDAAYTARMEKLKERELAALARQNEAIGQRILQADFPFWDDERRGVPNPFVRSGLFSVKISSEREYITKVRVDSLSNYDITYTGEELQQDDLSVWMALTNMARQQPMSDMVLFTGYQLVKDLGWSMNTVSYERAKRSIERLKVTALTIGETNNNQAYAGSLIREYAWNHPNGEGAIRWMVRFEPKVSMLFMQDTTSFIEWEQRKKIGAKNPVALWLHSFYTSHREPLPYSISKLYEMARPGSPLSTFRRSVQTAMNKLVKIGFLVSFEIINDVVHVQKAKLVAIQVNTAVVGTKRLSRKAA